MPLLYTSPLVNMLLLIKALLLTVLSRKPMLRKVLLMALFPFKAPMLLFTV